MVLLTMASLQAAAQDIPAKRALYGEQEIPGSAKAFAELGERDRPQLFFHKAESLRPEPLLFLIIPGGGYGMVAINHEGHDVAKRLAENGYSSYVLDYRLPKTETMKDKRFGPLQDAQKAMDIIRKENKGKKIAVIGFSAGGHLAASLSTLYDRPQLADLKPQDIRPDYSILCYPVISMEDGITHNGSKQNLIGPEPTAEDVVLFSLDKQVNAHSQPTFLMSAKDDKAVPIENSYRYLKQLNAHQIPNSMFTYEEGGHGFGLNNKTSKADWFAEMLQWIKSLEK